MRQKRDNRGEGWFDWFAQLDPLKRSRETLVSDVQLAWIRERVTTQTPKYKPRANVQLKALVGKLVPRLDAISDVGRFWSNQFVVAKLPISNRNGKIGSLPINQAKYS